MVSCTEQRRLGRYGCHDSAEPAALDTRCTVAATAAMSSYVGLAMLTFPSDLMFALMPRWLIRTSGNHEQPCPFDAEAVPQRPCRYAAYALQQAGMLC